MVIDSHVRDHRGIGAKSDGRQLRWRHASLLLGLRISPVKAGFRFVTVGEYHRCPIISTIGHGSGCIHIFDLHFDCFAEREHVVVNAVSDSIQVAFVVIYNELLWAELDLTNSPPHLLAVQRVVIGIANGVGATEASWSSARVFPLKQ